MAKRKVYKYRKLNFDWHLIAYLIFLFLWRLGIFMGNEELFFVRESLDSRVNAILETMSYDKVFVLCDVEILNEFLEPMGWLAGYRSSPHTLILMEEVSESLKNIETVIGIWEHLSRYGASRKSVLINIGGGVLTDMGGFAASCFKRGIPFINIPTTLLAQVDASCGGKTGINFSGYKNEIGCFASPRAVIIDNVFLRTLGEEERKSGFAEMLKHGLIAGSDELQFLLDRGWTECDSPYFLEAIRASVEIKRKIVKADPFESGVRKVLNFGHTAGHALEAVSIDAGAPLSHGAAVAWGMVVELELSLRKEGFPYRIFDEIRRFVEENYPYPLFPSFDFLWEKMVHDKKNTGGRVNFTLFSRPGVYVLDRILEREEVEEAFFSVLKSGVDLGQGGESAVVLPCSKSIANRMIVIRALAGGKESYAGDCFPEDVERMRTLVSMGGNRVYAGDAGSVMRFGLAYLAQKSGIWEIFGSERMHCRPIAPLVDVLRRLGVGIEYLGEEGYPPLRIEGRRIEGGKVTLDASVSSQFISALLLISPYFPRGLDLSLEGNIVSPYYIDMTLGLMRKYGADVSRKGMKIGVRYSPYREVEGYGEKDWTSASYFYQILALSDKREIFVEGLYSDSFQGDRLQTELWEELGIRTDFVGDGVRLVKTGKKSRHFKHDLVGMPDLIPSFVVSCCGLNIPFDVGGTSTLADKESDRIEVLKKNLGNLGFVLFGDRERILWEGERFPVSGSVVADSFGDHRIAMAFAPLRLVFPNLKISNPEVVKKSFPGFWEMFYRQTGLNSG